ncbi:heparinase II/III-family protein [Kribbella sp. NBC_01505]|uniref:heparinase II/III domain-containing protein n=1 Tax=Kribbella sp. NBC_01505 TaxID=2903580 RepID=UPI00386CEA02
MLAGTSAGEGDDSIVIAATPPVGYPCQGYSRIESKVPLTALMKDTFAWGNTAPYQVGNGAGDIKWDADPYQNISWQLWLYSLRWLGNGVKAMETGDAKATERVLAIVQDWVRDNPFSWKANTSASESTMHRTNVLICVRQALLKQLKAQELPAQYKWLDEALLTHARYLSDNWSGAHNHGTDQSIALLGVGCTYGRTDFMRLAAQRLNKAVKTAIDDQGTNNEQAVGYADFNYRLWGRASDRLRDCGVDPGPTIETRRKALGEWMAYATTATGYLHQIGNTGSEKLSNVAGTPMEYVATQGKKGPKPQQRLAIFKAGYVFGRTGWGEQRPFAEESTYSIRFGVARRAHGHDDHTAVTYNWKGHDILIDPGYGGHQAEPRQEWAKGPNAHNAMTVPTAQAKKSAARLDRSDSTADSDSFELSDEPAEGVDRTRDVLVLKDPDLMITLDRGRSGSEQRYETLWHLPPGQQVSVQSPTTAVAAKPGDPFRTHLLHIPIDGESGTTTVEQGSQNPPQGWYFKDIFTVFPAPVVKFTHSGRNARILSAIVPGKTAEQVSYTIRPDGADVVLDLVVGAQRVSVKITPEGRLTRLP